MCSDRPGIVCGVPPPESARLPRRRSEERFCSYYRMYGLIPIFSAGTVIQPPWCCKCVCQPPDGEVRSSLYAWLQHRCYSAWLSQSGACVARAERILCTYAEAARWPYLSVWCPTWLSIAHRPCFSTLRPVRAAYQAFLSLTFG